MTAYSIIIPAHNAAGTIATTLQALGSQTIPHHRYEIIIVDDGSTDGTAEVVQRFSQHQDLLARPAPPWSEAISDQPSPIVVRHAWPTIRLIRQSHQGAAAARNAGAQVARGDIILFLDADCVPAPDWLAHLIAPLDAAEVAGAGGRVQTHQLGVLPRFIQLEYDQRYERIAQHRYIDFISSATAAYRRETFQAVGGFDTTMLGAEDVDLSFRLAEAGYKLVFAPDALVYHPHPESLWVYIRRKFNYAFWRASVYSRHPRKVAGDSRTPQSQKLQIMLIPFIGLGLLGGLIWRPMWLMAGAALSVFLATTAPLARRAWQADPTIGLLSPLLLFASASAATAGLAVGILYRKLARRPFTVARSPSTPRCS